MEWDGLKKVDDVLYPTYRDACCARGLLQYDKEYIDGILEASLWGMGDYLCSIFVMLIMTDNLELLDIQRKNICLSYIECMLRSNNRSLKDIQNMPYLDQEYTMDGYNRLIYDETSYDKDQLREQHVKLYGSLTMKQKGIYSTVMDAVDNKKGVKFFVYGYGGTRKTYVYKTMSAALRSKGDIVLNVASSSIAALLLEGGRIAHSCFAILINVVEDLMCHIAADSDLADLICKVNLIIWDDGPMINIHFNIRLGSGSTESKKKEIQEFADWILEIGNGKVGGANDGESTIAFPDNMLIPKTDDHVGAIIDDTYPSDENEYESSDSVCLTDEDSNFDDSIYTTEFLNGLRMYGIPNHSIKLKI
nr:ATP-dependent DNA helicase RRM3-like [Tanacetum cinerariifolium]GEZ91488.1 ATP-dependent DNA helicase RRM3-like [Tanacetum cinerariifolium]